MRTKSPAQRSNDLHRFQKQTLTPANGVVRRMAEKIVHERVVAPQIGRGSGYKTGGRCFASRRFSEADVLSMRARRLGGESIAALAREFDVSYNNMRSILNGISYSWVSDPA